MAMRGVLICIAAMSTSIPLFACTPAERALPLSVSPQDRHAIKVTDDCQKATGTIDAIRIYIPTPGDAKLADAHSERHKYNVEADAVDEDSLGVVHTLPDGHTSADVSAGPYLQGKVSFVLIELVLQDKDGWSFHAGTNDAVFTDEDQGHGEMFCLKKAMTVKPGQRSVRFFVRSVPPASPGHALRGLYTFDARRTPNGPRILRLIDPEVENNGFN